MTGKIDIKINGFEDTKSIANALISDGWQVTVTPVPYKTQFEHGVVYRIEANTIEER